MPTKKTRNKSETTTADFAAEHEQSPKVIVNNLDSLDDILCNVDNFIEGVYRDLSITPPQRLSLNASCSGDNSSTSKSSPIHLDSSTSHSTSLTSPMGAIGGTGTLSPTVHVVSDSPTTAHRNMDAEIERINRICDNVDQNLRSIGVFMNNSRDNNSTITSEQNRHTDTSSDMVVKPVSPPTPPARGTYTRPLISVPDIQVVDLSETQTQTPEVLRPRNRTNNDDDDDDDVIIVSANINPVVDLCTPGYEEQTFRRPNMSHLPLRRRRLTEPDYDLQQRGTDEGGPSSGRRRRTLISEEHNSSINTVSTDASAQIQNNDEHLTIASGRTPFMCPICMESCLQRKPTSTKCGHVFCEVCIRHATRLTRKCPMCKTKISTTQLFRIYL